MTTDVPRVKEYFSQFLSRMGASGASADMTWDNGYNGVACAEYYLPDGRPLRAADPAALLR